jgi:hypothetical protein
MTFWPLFDVFSSNFSTVAAIDTATSRCWINTFAVACRLSSPLYINTGCPQSLCKYIHPSFLSSLLLLLDFLFCLQNSWSFQFKKLLDSRVLLKLLCKSNALVLHYASCMQRLFQLNCFIIIIVQIKMRS